MSPEGPTTWQEFCVHYLEQHEALEDQIRSLRERSKPKALRLLHEHFRPVFTMHPDLTFFTWECHRTDTDYKYFAYFRFGSSSIGEIDQTTLESWGPTFYHGPDNSLCRSMWRLSKGLSDLLESIPAVFGTDIEIMVTSVAAEVHPL